MNQSFAAARFSLLLLFASSAWSGEALPFVHPLFADHMVLQCKTACPVWGWSEPGDVVTVAFGGQTVTGTAGKDGRWEACLKALPVSAAGRTLTISSRKTGRKAVLEDVLVGEVWLCSGQSNMEMRVSSCRNSNAETAGATEPGIRMFTVGKALHSVPQERCRGAWVIATPETVGGFSAAGYFFAREVQAALDVPVGMLSASWGGTPAEGWTPLAAQRQIPALQQKIAKFEAALAKLDREAYAKARAKAVAAYQTQIRAWVKERDQVDRGVVEGWAAPAYQPTDWQQGTFPMIFDEELSGYQGFVWCRKEVTIPATWVGRELTVGFCAVDECHVAYVNGAEVGMVWYDARDFWLVPHQYQVPAAQVTSQRVVVTLRIFNIHGGIGTHGPSKDLFLKPATLREGETPLSLAGTWEYKPSGKVDPRSVPKPKLPRNIEDNAGTPSLLYNAMINPLIPYAIRGAIWYQGEANGGQPDVYRVLFPALIQAWRRAWGQGDFPFYFVQLANFQAAKDDPAGGDGWAAIREAQRATLGLANTGMAVSIDIGDAHDIHPRNKQDVGRRLARWALAKAYSQKVVASGPLYREHRVEGSAIRLFFDHVGGGLMVGRKEGLAPTAAVADGTLQRFAIARADGTWVWADARIEGETVVVSAAEVPNPVAVRYAYAMNPEGCNLYNREGLPASPFQTAGAGGGK